MGRLLADENFPFLVVLELRRLGHDVLTMQEAGQANQAVPDAKVLEVAAAEGRTLLTLNRKHFIRLHAEGASHAGIVVCTADPDLAGQARRIHDVLACEGELVGRLLRVNRPGG